MRFNSVVGVYACLVGSADHRRREPEELAVSINHHVPALRLGNDLAADDLVLPGN
jgi:hypothetical protein